MSLLTNIKYQYNLRILEDFISTNNYHDFFIHLEKQRGNNTLYKQLLFTIGSSAILNNQDDIFKSKIIWLSSFMKDDLSYIASFFEYYNNEIDTTIGDISLYEEKIINILNNLSNINLQNLNFSDFVERSYLYQYLILHENANPIKFLVNHLPFFSTKDNLNFTKSLLTNSFVHIIDNPYNVYQKIKNNFNGDKSMAQNIFLNLDNHSKFEKINSTDVEINKQGWHTHTLSWIDSNVINSLNGKIILKKDLIENTFEVLSSILLHFIQSGIKIKMDYNLINSFIDRNPPENIKIEIDISQKERKFIEKYINSINSKFNFDG